MNGECWCRCRVVLSEKQLQCWVLELLLAVAVALVARQATSLQVFVEMGDKWGVKRARALIQGTQDSHSSTHQILGPHHHHRWTI